jgi:adenine/guanine phosphoribosyltransferase-like PRPP-binding protein
MVDVTFDEVFRRLRDAAFPEFDVVLGIEKGGTIPAAMVSYVTGKELRLTRFAYRDEDNHPAYPEPVLMGNAELPESARSVLLVDDARVSGRTMEAAKALCGKRAVHTLVLKGEADLVLFPEIRSCANWPWKKYCINWNRS